MKTISAFMHETGLTPIAGYDMHAMQWIFRNPTNQQESVRVPSYSVPLQYNRELQMEFAKWDDVKARA